MSESTLLQSARDACEALRDRLVRTDRVAAHVVPAAIKHGLTTQEVAELTGLAEAEVEEYRERGT